MFYTHVARHPDTTTLVVVTKSVGLKLYKTKHMTTDACYTTLNDKYVHNVNTEVYVRVCIARIKRNYMKL